MLSEVESLIEFAGCGFLKKLYPQGRSQTLVYQSWIARHAFILMLYMCVLLVWSAVACSIHVGMILYIDILNVWCHIRGKIASEVAVRGEGGVAGEERVVGVPSFIPGISAPWLRLDVQCFLWPVNYIKQLLYFASWGVITVSMLKWKLSLGYWTFVTLHCDYLFVPGLWVTNT